MLSLYCLIFQLLGLDALIHSSRGMFFYDSTRAVLYLYIFGSAIVQGRKFCIGHFLSLGYGDCWKHGAYHIIVFIDTRVIHLNSGNSGVSLPI